MVPENSSTPTGEIHLKVVTPEGIIWEGRVDEAVFPGQEGRFGVLPGHEPYMAELEPGELKLKWDDEVQLLNVTGGYARIADNEISVLTQGAEKAEDIDEERARAAYDRAEKRLEEARQLQQEEGLDESEIEIDVDHSYWCLERAKARLKVVEHYRKIKEENTAE